MGGRLEVCDTAGWKPALPQATTRTAIFAIAGPRPFPYARPMKQRFLLWLGVAAALGLAPALRADRVDDYIKDEMAQHRIPGVALKIIRDGKAIKTAAYGTANLEHNVPVKAETVFEIGSITKQFTAAGILLLQQDGKLSVEDPIRKYLPEIPPAWTNITIRHLLTHTSGIKSYTVLDGFQLTRHQTQKQFIEKLGAVPVEFAPGAAFKYCNSGFNLLGYIIENVSGKNYWDFMYERVFGPLGMNATTNRLPMLVIPNRASGYEQTHQVWINRDYDLTDVFSAGALVSTVGDLAKWNAALDTDTLLNARTKQQMWTVNKLNNGKATRYGFGWFIDSQNGHRNIGHGGSTSGFSASIQRYPDDKLAIIILTNTDEAVGTRMAQKIATLCLEGGE